MSCGHGAGETESVDKAERLSIVTSKSLCLGDGGSAATSALCSLAEMKLGA